MSSSPTLLKSKPPGESHIPLAIYLQLGGAVLVWGANWAMTKSVLPNISPENFVAIRFLSAVPFIAVLAITMRQSLLPVRGERLPLAIIGIVQIAAGNFLCTVGLQYVGAGRSVVLFYTMQLWALPLGWLINRDRAGWRAMCGGAIGFLGLGLFLINSQVNWHSPKVVMGNCLCLSAGLTWAVGACLYRRIKWQTPFWTQTLWQVLGSAIALAPLLLVPQRATVWNGRVIAMLAYNAIGATALAWWWWGKALSVMPASRAGQIVTLTPVVAVIIGTLWAGEPLTATTAVSVTLICLGIIVTLRGRQAALLSPKPSEQ